MRQELVPFIGKEVTIQATLECYGLKLKNSCRGAQVTMLLKDMEVSDGVNTTKLNHCWVDCGPQVKYLNIREGSQVKLNAVINYYNKRKGSKGKYQDIGIKRVIDMTLIKSNNLGKNYQEFLYAVSIKQPFMHKNAVFNYQEVN